MTRCAVCLKYSTYAFVIMLFLSGIITIILASVLLSKSSSYDVKDFAGREYYDSAAKVSFIILIIFGLSILLLAVLGFCGIYYEKPDLLAIFGIFVMLLFIIELGMGIYNAASVSGQVVKLETTLRRAFYSSSLSERQRQIFSYMEKKLKCCGLKSYSDYYKIPRMIPSSCCADEKDCTEKPNFFWREGCLPKLKSFLTTLIQAGVALSFLKSIFLAAGCILTLLLIISMYRKRREV